MQDQTHDYIIDNSTQIDLSKLDFNKLRAEFPEKKHKNIQFADLRELMEVKLKQMLGKNKTRGSFVERFERIIENYNSGSLLIEEAYEDLMKQAKQYLIFPENIGSHLFIDETALSKGELYTIITNKKAKGKKGSIVAIFAGTKVEPIIKQLLKIPANKRAKVKEITLDMANSMKTIAK